MKEENIANYYNGTVAYTLFLQDIIYGTTENSNLILDKNYMNVAIIGFISNIFLIIKEGLIEKQDITFNSLILEDILEKNVNIIAKKTEDGYKIDNYVFKNKETLVTEIRNKIAHGNFNFDLCHNRIILNIENNDIKININKLSAFVVASLDSYLKNYKTNEFSRKMVINNKILSNRKKPMLTKSEIRGFIKKYRQKIITLKSKDSSIIPKPIIEEFEQIITKYEYEHTDEKELYKNIISFEKKYGNNYEIINESKPFKNIDYDTFPTYFLNSIKETTTYDEQVTMLLKELEINENIENNKLNILIDNLHNLIILDTIKKTNSTNLDIIGEKIYEEYGNIFISSNTLISSLIACFNALFSYGKDNIYKNDNKYSVLNNNGLDYSKLDLTLFNIELCNIDKGYIIDLKTKVDSKYKDLEKIEEKINQISENINKVNKLEVINKLKETLLNIESRKIEVKELYNNLLNEYKSANDYFNNNIDYLTNERIIDGIRNSIAHGNYYIISKTDLNNSIIVFEDVYEGKLTFKCSIKINDFIKFLSDNAPIISNFLNNINNNKTKKLTK